MTSEDAEAALRAAYGKKLSEAFGDFIDSLRAVNAEAFSNEAMARLFASHGSFPAYSVWRKAAFQENGAPATAAEAAEPKKDVSPRLRAKEILRGSQASKEEWNRLVKHFAPRRLKKEDHSWALSEDELAEGLA